MNDALSLKVMTWNVYLGGEIARVLNVKPGLLEERARALWSMVNATDFKERARAIAKQVARQAPDVLALQEVFQWTRIERHGMREPVQTVVFDFLPELVAALAEQGCGYFVAVHAPGTVVTLPLGESVDVRLQDSIALLLRVQPESGPLADLHWENARQARFSSNLSVRIDGEQTYIARGWGSLDLRQGEGRVRIVTTHMEYFDDQVRPLQTRELLDLACGVNGPRILLGDFNSHPSSDVGLMFRQHGFEDVWIDHGAGKGATSGLDEDLRNAHNAAFERLDWILVRGPIEVESVERVGHVPDQRTPSGMWPSDHAGVVASLKVRMDWRRVRPPAEQAADTAVEVVRQLFERFIAKDIMAMMSLIHPDARMVFPGNPSILPWAGEYRGAGFERFVGKVVQTIEYLDYRMQDIWGNGNQVVATSRERCRILANGCIFEHDLVALIRVEEGKVVEFIEFSDTGRMERAIQGSTFEG